MLSETCDQCDKWPTDKPVLIDGGILCVDCAGRRIAALDKDNDRLMKKIADSDNFARWRKWSEEKPENSGQYLVFWGTEPSAFITDYDLTAETRWKHCISPPTYWRPIGPLPGGE